MYLHRIVDIRLDGAALRCLTIFRDICGEHYLQNTVIATSMWDTRRNQEDIEESEGTEQELKEERWKPLLDMGAMYARSYNTKQGYEDIIRRIVEKAPKAPELQTELGSGLDLGQTKAGVGLRSELEKVMELYQRQADEIKQR